MISDSVKKQGQDYQKLHENRPLALFRNTPPLAAGILYSATSFGLIRGGHVDLTVLGGLQVDQHGMLANWMISGKMVPGMGGAMDLVTGAKRVVVAMQHTAKGRSKIMKACSLPLTSARPVDLVVTELAVIAFPEGRATLVEIADGITVDQVLAATEADLIVPDQVPSMAIQTETGGS